MSGRTVFFNWLTPDDVRAGSLYLARFTGWPVSDIEAMPVSKFMWWIEGLPKK
jgi:hypothetical protein